MGGRCGWEIEQSQSSQLVSGAVDRRIKTLCERELAHERTITDVIATIDYVGCWRDACFCFLQEMGLARDLDWKHVGSAREEKEKCRSEGAEFPKP
jgi:hypothetical protein